MGCDIHCFIEYKPKHEAKWQSFGGEIRGDRNYLLFGAMAGVRSDTCEAVPARGRQADYGHNAADADRHWISDSLEPGGFGYVDGEYCYSRQRAEEYIAQGYAEGIKGHDGKVLWITNSDHHSHSWLTADEFEAALSRYLNACGYQVSMPKLMSGSTAEAAHAVRRYELHAIKEYWPMLAALRCFEMQGYDARLVFWFDN